MCIGIIEWIAAKEKYTREDMMMHKFGLADKEQLRPLLFQLKDDGLIRQGNRGFTSTTKLTKLSKVIAGSSN